MSMKHIFVNISRETLHFNQKERKEDEGEEIFLER